MIVDSFIFFSELDLLEVRLHELDPFVDKFVLVESRKTFQGNPKPLHYWDNRKRFERFEDKIIHVEAKLPDGSSYEDGWLRERISRQAVRMPLADLPLDAILLLSDLDEIPNLSGWNPNVEVPVVWSHQLFYYFVDVSCGCRIKGTVGIPLKRFWEDPDISGDGHKLREWRHYNVERVLGGERGGWHFSYLGGVEKIREKILAFAHAELLPHADPAKVEKSILEKWREGVDLFDRKMYAFEESDGVDLPKYLLDNKERFAHFWSPKEEHGNGS